MQEKSLNNAKNYTIMSGLLASVALPLASFICAFLVLLSGWYWFFGFSMIGIASSLIFSSLIGIWSFTSLAARSPIRKQSKEKSLFIRDTFFVFIFVATTAFLLHILIQRRTGDTLISPWTLVGPKFFLLFFVMHFCGFIFLLRRNTSKFLWIILLAEYILFLLVALIVFKHGYGFDHHIHEAAERWIDTHGLITPKQPYYIAEYMLVLVLHRIFRVSIFAIDMALVPILSSILIPLVGLFAFRGEKYRGAGIAALPILTLPFFIHTTPNNFAMLLALLTIFFSIAWYREQENKKAFSILLILLGLLTTAVHAFIGLPILFFLLTIYLLKKFTAHRARILSLSGIILVFVVPVVYVVNAYRLGVSGVLRPVREWLNMFILFFDRPHWEWIDKATPLWQGIYYTRDIFKVIILVSIVIFALWIIRKKNDVLALSLLTAAGSLFLSALFLAIPIQHKELVGYEQAVYAMRLKQLSMLFLFPLFLQFLFWLFERYRTRAHIIFVSFFCAVLLSLAWYFTYPTRDPVSRFTGYPVRDADLEAVDFIHTKANGEPYIVIANQSVGAAALKHHGFSTYYKTPDGEQYFYSIPTGGILYPYFAKMVYEEPKRQWMHQAMDIMGVDRAYFVHTSYWAPAAKIRDAAKYEADNWWEFGQGQAWVYEYVR